MKTSIEEKRIQLTQEIELAKQQLQNNIENIEISDYVFNQFNIKSQINKLTSSTQSNGLGSITDITFGKGSLLTKIIALFKLLG